MVHGLDHQRIAVGPVVAAAGDQPDAHRIAPGHQPVAVVLDLVNPVGAGRGLVGGGGEAGFDEARPVGGQALTHTLDQHAANLADRGSESNAANLRNVTQKPQKSRCGNGLDRRVKAE